MEGQSVAILLCKHDHAAHITHETVDVNTRACRHAYQQALVVRVEHQTGQGGAEGERGGRRGWCSEGELRSGQTPQRRHDAAVDDSHMAESA